MHATICSPFGARCEIDSTHPQVLAALSPALTGFPDLGLTDRLRFTVRWIDDTDEDPAWPLTSTRWDGNRLELRCGSALLQTDAADASAVLTLCPAIAAIPDAVRMMFEGALSSLLIGRGRLHAVHAAMVGDGDRTVVLRGQSGAGKSTLTYACLRAGLMVASDDWSYHAEGTPAELLAGYPWRIFLMPDTSRWFAELADIAPVAHPGADRHKLPVEPDPSRWITHARADAVVFLEPGTTPELARIPQHEAIERFWASALPSERADLPASFVEALTDRPTWRLCRGDHPARAAELIQRLLADR